MLFSESNFMDTWVVDGNFAQICHKSILDVNNVNAMAIRHSEQMFFYTQNNFLCFQ